MEAPAAVDQIGLPDKVMAQNEHHYEALFGIFRVLVTWGAVGSMIFGGVVPYIPQYRTIRRTRDAEGFSTFVCLVLLVANILRILFWLGVHYETPLLIQSIIMIITMMVMMEICTSVNSDKGTVVRRITDFDLNYFWKWTRFGDYCIFVSVFSIIGTTVTVILLNVSVYIELLGYASLLMEACLGVPQLWRNFNNKSTEGMSVQMVIMWFCGDTFKTVYFVARQAPAQFWLCGTLQVIIDIMILGQVMMYRSRVTKTPRTH